MKNKKTKIDQIEKLIDTANKRAENPKEWAIAIQNFAEWIVLSTLKKLEFATCKKSYAAAMSAKKSPLAIYRAGIFSDKTARNSAEDTISDGSDLISAAIVATLTEIDRIDKIGAPLDLTAPYTVKKPRRKIYIDNSAPEMVEKQTTPIQEIFRAVRREIENNRAARSTTNGYTYIEDYATDDECAENIIYRRFSKYADIGGYVNGTYTAGENAINIMDIIQKMALTPREMQILNYRQSGLSVRDIAEKMKISKSAAQRAIEKIREKSRKIGFAPKK